MSSGTSKLPGVFYSATTTTTIKSYKLGELVNVRNLFHTALEAKKFQEEDTRRLKVW